MLDQSSVAPLGTTGAPGGPARGAAEAVFDTGPVSTSLMAETRYVRRLQEVVRLESLYDVLVEPVSAETALQFMPPSVETSIL